jgi:hypothetical protein
MNNEEPGETTWRQESEHYRRDGVPAKPAIVPDRARVLQRLLRQCPCPDMLRDHVLAQYQGRLEWFELSSDTVTVGAAADMDISIDSDYLSSHHCTLSKMDGVWTVTDAGSKNGLRVNEQPTEKAVLKDHDFVRMTEVTLIFVARAKTTS